MHRFWTLFSGPIVETVRPKRILEIGAEFGWNTRNILEYCRRAGARADVIDPVALPSLRDVLAAYPEVHTYHQSKSHEVISKLDTPDIIFLDGDHNWRTVFSELTQIYTRARKTDCPPPILLAHDCAWPYARRDMYYDPDALPPEERHPYAYKGMLPGESELTDKGLNGRFANALHEGGPQNGVLTGIEDFIASWATPISLTVLPFFNGMGIAIPKERRTPELDTLLASFLGGDKLLEAAKAIERQTMIIIAEGLQRDAILTRRTDALRRARDLLAEQAAKIATLEGGAERCRQPKR
jgi:Methyltransferase domain